MSTTALTKCHCKLYPFQYEPLPSPRHVRLLKLSPESSNSHIHATLEHYDIDSAPHYTAVSYRWRSSFPLRAIHVNGMRFWVRTNLLNLFRELRMSGKHGLLWIDAISINQSDVAERSSQVRIMGSIYSKAKVVLSWLDSIDEKTLRRAHELLSDSKLWMYIDFRDAKSDADSGWGAIDKIIDHEYWTRTWIIQEVIGAEQVLLQCGSYAMSLSILEDFTYWLKSRESCLTQMDPAWRRTATTNCLQLCDHRITTRARPDARQPLEHNLMRYANFNCLDPRDKVYSLLDISVSIDNPITVNYGMSCAQLFQEVLQCLADGEVMGTQEVVGTAVLLYQQLLCWYGSQYETLDAIRSLGNSARRRIWPYLRGIVDPGIPQEYMPYVDSLREGAVGLRIFPDRASGYQSDYALWKNIPDVSMSRSVPAADLVAFAVKADPSRPKAAQTARFGYSACLPVAGDEVWQFSNTDFALLIRQQLVVGTYADASTVFKIVGPAQLYEKQGEPRWNPFLKATDMSNVPWINGVGGFREVTANLRDRSGEVNDVDLLKLVLMVTRM